ncbi:MAG: hypothetical protein IPK10_09655 [Bacteroidetes bacterium]|nr:hypothetical protein [Bacteroidota bacterium]
METGVRRILKENVHIERRDDSEGGLGETSKKDDNAGGFGENVLSERRKGEGKFGEKTL